MPINVKLPKKKNHEDFKRPHERIINSITFFGDSAIPEEDEIFQSVKKTAKLLAKNGYTIVNGGGPGIMKAATDGAVEANGKTVAVYWEPKLASHFEGKNLSNITNESEAYSNYVMRTLGLIEKGDAYIVCKGGTGTISEFGMVWCLAKLYYGVHKPVILYGDFWDDLIIAFQKAMYLDEVELSVLNRARTPGEVLMLLEKFELFYKNIKQQSLENDESGFILSPKSKITINTYNKHAQEYHLSHVGKHVAEAQLEEFISVVHPPAEVLDIGCGAGTDTKYLSSRYRVTGIDLSYKLVNIARFENPGANIVHGDIITYNLPKNKYKGIWSRDAIHHIPEEHLDEVFKKIYDALVEEGIFYMIVREGLGEIIEKEKKNYSEIERFYHLFSADEIIQRALKVGFKVEKIDHTQKSHKWIAAILRK